MAKPPTAVRILDVLKKDAIATNLGGTSKKEVLSELVSLLFKQQSEEVRQEILQSLQDREKLGSTGIGSGVAVPHAKSEKTSSISCALGVVRRGVDFEALDQAPVYLIFLLVAPPTSQSEHLNILARIVRLLKDGSFRQTLQGAKNSDEVVQLIAQQDS